MAMSPTQRTLKALKDQGCICGIVERFNRFGGPYGIRQDLFGFLDIIALYPGEGSVGIQSCGQDYSGHVRKIKEERNLEAFEWLNYHRAELWGWRKVKLKKGGKAMRWKPRIGDIVITDDDNIDVVERK